MGKRFRPRLVSTLLVLVGLAILIALGTWQLKRYNEKTVLEEQVRQNIDAPITVLQSTSAFVDKPEMDSRPAKLVGAFDTQAKSHVIKHRIRDGKPGFWILTPWEFPDGSKILVNRGWFPFAEGTEFVNRAGFPDGDWTGIVQKLPRVIADDAGRKATCDTYCVWNSFDVIGASEQSGIGATDWIIVADDSATVQPYPVGGHEHVTEPYLTSDRHLGYVGTWYGMAGALFCLWLAASFGLLGRRA